MVIRVVLKTAPLKQWGVARELRERIKERFDREHIEIPFAQRVVWHRDMPEESPPSKAAETPEQAEAAAKPDSVRRSCLLPFAVSTRQLPCGHGKSAVSCDHLPCPDGAPARAASSVIVVPVSA